MKNDIIADLPTIIRKSKVRWSRKLNQEIDKVLTRYNAKIDRLRRKQADYILPSKMTKENLMETSYTTKDVRRRLADLSKFNERNATDTFTTSGGYNITRYEFNFLKREQRRVKAKLDKEILRYQTEAPTVFGVRQGFTFAQMGDSTYLNLKAKRQALEKDIRNLSQEEFIKYRNVLYKLGKNRDYLAEGFRDNYLDIMFDIGYYIGYDKDKLKVLENKFMELTPEQFYKLYLSEKGIKMLRDYYQFFTDIEDKKEKGRDPSALYGEDISSYLDELINNIDDIVAPYL